MSCSTVYTQQPLNKNIGLVIRFCGLKSASRNFSWIFQWQNKKFLKRKMGGRNKQESRAAAKTARCRRYSFRFNICQQHSQFIV